MLIVVVEKVVEAERRVLVGVGHVVQGGGVDAVAGAYLEDVALGSEMSRVRDSVSEKAVVRVSRRKVR